LTAIAVARIVGGKTFVNQKDDLAVIAIAVLPVVFSVFSIDSLSAIHDASIYIYFAAVYFVTKTFIRTKIVSPIGTVSYLAISFYIILLIGLLQMTTGTPVGLVARYFGANAEEASLYAGAFRVSSTMTSPNVFALVISFLLPIAIWHLSRRRKKADLLLVTFGIFVSGLAVVISSGSRAGLMFFSFTSLSSFFFWLRSGKKFKNRWITVAILLLFSLLVASYIANFGSDKNNTIYSRYSDGMNSGDTGRLSMYSGAIKLLSDPKILLLGAGAGQFFDEINNKGIQIDYKEWVDYRNFNSSVHNWMLQILTECGIFTFLAWLSFVGLTLKRAIWLKNSEGGAIFLILGINVFLTFAVPLQFDTSISNPTVLTLLATCGALVNSQYIHRLRIEGK